MLRDRDWAPGYTNDNGSLTEQFYIPALMEAVQYDRGTGYFGARSLAGNMRGIEGLLRNKGKMRLLVGCTLKPDEIEAVRRGEDLKRQVERNLCNVSLIAPDTYTASGLELLSWMIATNRMDVRVAVMCDHTGLPVAGNIYHKKIGVVRDKSGDKIAWGGSDNETHGGQSANSESLNVFTSWEQPKHQIHTEKEFEKDWSGRPGRLVVMDVPEAVRHKLLKHAPPKYQLPARLHGIVPAESDMWSFIWQAPKNDEMVGLATAPVVPWPHQVEVFRRLHSGRPARLLIADEVGLGKTIQAGLFLRQAWLEGRRRILVLAPAGLTKQWQIELREKMNLDWPIYDGKSLLWQHTHAKGERKEVAEDWASRGPAIVSSHLARMKDREREIVSAQWDVVVLDEAHYARQQEPTNPDKHTPNKMLRLMKRLQGRTQDLLLLTATPMQLHQVELYDLLSLLGLPSEWTWDRFERFYARIHDMDREDIQSMGELFRASTRMYGAIDASSLSSSNLRNGKVIGMLEGDGKRPQTGDYAIMKKALLSCSPVTRLVSRNTRKQLRQHMEDTRLDWNLATRQVRDEFVTMNPAEWRIYKEVEDYIRKTWNAYRGTNKQAVGFVVTTYRKRLTSSFAALRETLERHLKRLDAGGKPLTYEDEYDDMDATEIEKEEGAALKELDRKTVQDMLCRIRKLPPDTKLERLLHTVDRLMADGHRQIIVFTQFTDTMDYLRELLKVRWNVMCYSGRHGEAPGPDGSWNSLSRDEVKARFLDGTVDVLLCTDAAAEGLNFQFCGAMINYDMPWNPMRVEQRIGRIDRIGQKYDQISITNMYYEDTIEADIYRALRERINLFKDVLGGLQPILDKKIMGMVLNGDTAYQKVVDESVSGPNLDDMLAASTAQHESPKSTVTMYDLDRIAGNRSLMRKYEAEMTGKGQYSITALDKRVRITTDREQFEKHGDSMEFWSPGSPAFPEVKPPDGSPECRTLGELLDAMYC